MGGSPACRGGRALILVPAPVRVVQPDGRHAGDVGLSREIISMGMGGHLRLGQGVLGLAAGFPRFIDVPRRQQKSVLHPLPGAAEQHPRVAVRRRQIQAAYRPHGVQIKINIQKNEGHKRYLGLKIGDSFLDSKGFRCVVTDIIRKDPYQDWQDLAPTLSIDEYPSVSYGHGRKWNR